MGCECIGDENCSWCWEPALTAVDAVDCLPDNEAGYDEGTEPWEDADLLDWEYDPSVKDGAR